MDHDCSARATPRPSGGEPATSSPQHCPICHGELAYPIDWRRADASIWALTVHCPDCETTRSLTLDREQMHRYNVLLYESSERLAREIEALAREYALHEETACRSFATALHRDLILPMDF